MPLVLEVLAPVANEWVVVRRGARHRRASRAPAFAAATDCPLDEHSRSLPSLTADTKRHDALSQEAAGLGLGAPA